MLTQMTQADGYVFCGHWDHTDSVAVQCPGEIVVSVPETWQERMCFMNEWFALAGYMPL
jgi:hypothetical protein